jgi:transcriptional regulator with XRE-family HTH domain
LLQENGDRFHPLLEANNSQMNFTQMHERLRVELLRRIQRGTLNVSLLSRQTGLGQSHISNFLRRRRNLSLDAMDRILRAQQMAADELLSNPRERESASFATSDEQIDMVPVVSYRSALSEPIIRPSAIASMMPLPAGALQSIRARPASSRQAWQRFVAVRVSTEDAQAMEPLFSPEAYVVIDRHCNSLDRDRPSPPTFYAVRNGANLSLRYLNFRANRLILRPRNEHSRIEVLDVEPGRKPSESIIGKVVLVLNQV